MGAWVSDSNFNSRKADRNLGDLFTVGKPVLYVQLDGVLYVVDGLFVCFALAIATLESGTGNEKTVGVRFDDDWKSDVLHDVAHYRSVMGTGETEFAEECDGRRTRLMGKVKGPTRWPAYGAPAGRRIRPANHPGHRRHAPQFGGKRSSARAVERISGKEAGVIRKSSRRTKAGPRVFRWLLESGQDGQERAAESAESATSRGKAQKAALEGICEDSASA